MSAEKAAEGQGYGAQRRSVMFNQQQTAPTRRRLPTLAEVLARRTLPPVDLYCYYLFLQREGSEDSLDFWLDVQQHENLCRAYFKDLRRTGKALREEWPDYWRQAKVRGSIYNRVNGVDEDDDELDERDRQTRGGTTDLEYETQQSATTRPPEASSDSRFGPGTEEQREELLSESGPGGQTTTDHSRSRSGAQSDFNARQSTVDGPRFPGDPDYPLESGTKTNTQRRSLLAKRASLAPTVIARSSAITKTDLVASAERIYARYLLPGSEKEIYLPPQLRIVSFPIGTDRPLDDQDPEQMKALARVPDMFHPQKE